MSREIESWKSKSKEERLIESVLTDKEYLLTDEDMNDLEQRLREHPQQERPEVSKFWRRRKHRWSDKITYTWYVWKFAWNAYWYSRFTELSKRFGDALGIMERESLIRLNEPYLTLETVSKLTKGRYKTTIGTTLNLPTVSGLDFSGEPHPPREVQEAEAEAIKAAAEERLAQRDAGISAMHARNAQLLLRPSEDILAPEAETRMKDEALVEYRERVNELIKEME